MAGPHFPSGSAALRRALAGGLLLAATGCATLAPPPESALPSSSAATPAAAAASAPASAPASASASAAESAVEAGARTNAAPAAGTAAEPAGGTAADPAAEPAAEVPRPSRLAALAKRLLDKFRKPQPPAPAAEPAPAPPPEQVVDEKYRLTGEAALELERGRASWYGARFHGQPTASGEPYDKYALTAAHKTLPFGTIVRVRSLKLGREVDVRINDRGPFTPGRVIDVSQAAAEALGITAAGVAEVSLKVAESQLDKAGVTQPQNKARSAQTGSRNAKGKKTGARNIKSTKSAKSTKSPGANAKPRSRAPQKAPTAKHG